MKKTLCPLGTAWREEWDLWFKCRYESASPEEAARVHQARTTCLGKKIKTLNPRWSIALDDARHQPPQKGSSFYPGYPRHRHTNFKVDENAVHVDWVCAQKGGPGRFFMEIRIFVNDILAGRSSAGGAAYGGGSNGPAVALVGSDKLLLVTEEREIVLWKRGRRIPPWMRRKY